MKSEMYKRAIKSQLRAQNCQNFKTQSLDLAISNICVILNINTVYDKNQIT